LDDGGTAQTTFTNCTFQNNNSTYASVYFSFENATATFNDCRFVNNSQSDNGAVAFLTIDTTPVFNNCNFTDNVGGFVISSFAKTLDLRNCRFANNRLGASASIFLVSSNATLTNSTLEDMDTLQESAGIQAMDSNVTISGCHFRNLAGTHSAAVWALKIYRPSTIDIRDSTFENISSVYD
jgi:hypothetical protein